MAMPQKHFIKQGDRFHNWVVSAEPRRRRVKGKTRIYVSCVCDCGTRRNVVCGSLYGGRSKSCGCRNRRVHWKHGLSESPECRIYSDAKQRCLNPRNKGFKNYGGRGMKYFFY